MFNLGVIILYEFQIVFTLSSFAGIPVYSCVFENPIVQEESKLK